MSVFKRGRYYHYEFEYRGRRYRASTHRRNKQAAQLVESNEKRRLLDEEQGFVVGKLPLFEDFADDFLLYSKNNQAAQTHALHAINVGNLKRFFKGRRLDKISREQVEDFKIRRSREERRNAKKGEHIRVSGATVNRCLTTLKRIYSYAVFRDLKVSSPVKGVKYLKESDGRLRVLTPEEIELYLSLANVDLRDFGRLLYETGLRPGEAYRLHKSGFDPERKIIHVPGTKTPKSKRDVPLMGQSLEIVLRRAKETPTGYLFWPGQQRGKHAAKFGHVTTYRKARDGIVKKHLVGKEFVLYDFRHTYATRMVQSGCDLYMLQSLLGHASLEMTTRYVHPAHKEKERAVEQFQAYLEELKKRGEPKEEAAAEDYWESPDGTRHKVHQLKEGDEYYNDEEGVERPLPPDLGEAISPQKSPQPDEYPDF